MSGNPYRNRITRPCMACGRQRSCRWSIDAWICSAQDCGAEWYPLMSEALGELWAIYQSPEL
jgi:ribosomal protein L37AE/L43A